jgi:hypothetical protein
MMKFEVPNQLFGDVWEARQKSILILALMATTACMSLQSRDKTRLTNGITSQGQLTTRSKLDDAAQNRLANAYGKLPLHFEANQGQTDDKVKFLSRGSGYNLFLTSTEAVMVLVSGARKTRPISYS